MQKWYNKNTWANSYLTVWRKRMDIKKIAAAVAALCISLGISGLLAPDAQATGDLYEMSEAYKSSKYYENLKDVPLGGDQAIDVVAVALSQLGYHEGDSDNDFGGALDTGSRDYVEYNLMFGKLDNGQGNGVSYGYSWCASFATWCLRHAGVSEEQSGQTGAATYRSCWQWRRACIESGIYREKQGYQPQMGDIIFFKDINDPSIKVDSSHVGIVLFSDENNVYTIEGNANRSMGSPSVGDCVAVKSYPLDSDYIVGYALPRYVNTEEKYFWGWQDVSNNSWEITSLDKHFDAAKSGAQIRPVWRDLPWATVSAGEIAGVILVIGGFAAGVAVLLINIFGKKSNKSKNKPQNQEYKNK